jgi:hypothetical protein
MSFYLSAGIYTKEVDLSTIVPAISTTSAGLVGYSAKGSLDLTLVTNKQQFINEYGEPTPGNYFHYTALAFLARGTQLWCRRVINGSLYPGVHIKDSLSSENNEVIGIGQINPNFFDESGISDELFTIYAKDPGIWGNNLSVIIKNVKDGAESEVTEQYTFEIDVYLTDAEGTSAKVENFKVSRQNPKMDGYGRQMYLETRINGYSDYIVVADSSRAATLVPKAQATALSFAGGTDGSTVTASQIAGIQASRTGYFSFFNPDDVDVRILIGGGFLSSHTAADIVTIQSAIKTICESRLDCFGVLDVPFADASVPADSVTFRDTTQNFNSSYTALYAPWPRINDPYNDMLVYLPPSGYAAAQYAYNDYVAQPWNAPAGFTRGLLNVVGLSYVYTQGERDLLYFNGINPLQVFSGEGIAVWGQKTQQSKASALDRVNVRRLLIIIEKAMAISLRPFAFEPNDDITRLRIKGQLDRYLADLGNQGAFQTEAGDNGFIVVCDTNNNTPQIIDRNELHVDVFVKPSRAAEFIELKVIVTDTGASFDELVGKGARL